MRGFKKSKPKVKPAPAHQHRMCIACRVVAPKEELLRLRIVDGALRADEQQTGRGCYVHLGVACLSKLREAHRLEHAFRLVEKDRTTKSQSPKRASNQGAAVKRKLDRGSVQRLIESLVAELRAGSLKAGPVPEKVAPSEGKNSAPMISGFGMRRRKI